MTDSTSTLNNNQHQHKQWYLVTCQRGGLDRSQHHLENQGVECFYPKIDVEKIVRNKKQTVSEPLFPGYMFIALPIAPENDLDAVTISLTTIRSTRGVRDFVRSGVKREPAKVSSDLINLLKDHLADDQEQQRDQMPRDGQEVHIKNGPFTGINAIYKESDGEKRSFLMINIINQPIKTSVENKDIEW